MSEITTSDARDHRFLRYYAKSLLVLGPAGRDWPGFRYTPEEWRRLELYGGTVPGRAGTIAMFAAAAIFILIAAAAICLVFLPLMLWLYPDPSKTSALVFVSTLFAVSFLAIGVGYPIALNAGGFVADRFTSDEPIPITEEDRRLAAQVRRQVWRMMSILCGIGIPATMILVIYDIDLAPVTRWLKPVAYGLMFLVMAASAWSTRGSKG